MQWLGFKTKLTASWSAVAFLQSSTYTAPPICILSACYFDIAIKSWGLFMCACTTRILAVASIREQQLFPSAHPEVRRLIEWIRYMPQVHAVIHNLEHLWAKLQGFRSANLKINEIGQSTKLAPLASSFSSIPKFRGKFKFTIILIMHTSELKTCIKLPGDLGMSEKVKKQVVSTQCLAITFSWRFAFLNPL